MHVCSMFLPYRTKRWWNVLKFLVIFPFNFRNQLNKKTTVDVTRILSGTKKWSTFVFVVFCAWGMLLVFLSLLILSCLHVALVPVACCTVEGQGQSVFIKVVWQDLNTTGLLRDYNQWRSGRLSPWSRGQRCALSCPLNQDLMRVWIQPEG